jgi:hypothetical protein
MRSTSPGLATVVTPCTSDVSTLATRGMGSGVKRLTSAMSGYGMVDAGRRRFVWRIVTAHRSAYRNRASFGVSQQRFIRRIATAHRSAYRNRASFLLGTVQGQPSATMVGIDGVLGKSSPLQVHRSFAMLVSRLINHPGDSLADSRWSLARCDAGYSTRFAVFGGPWSVRFGRFNAATLGRRFGDAKTSSERKAPGESRLTF